MTEFDSTIFLYPPTLIPMSLRITWLPITCVPVELLAKSVKLYQWPDPYELKQNYSDRNTEIALACQSGGYSMEEIGIFFGLHYSWLSRVIRDFEKAKNKT